MIPASDSESDAEGGWATAFTARVERAVAGPMTHPRDQMSDSLPVITGEKTICDPRNVIPASDSESEAEEG